MEKDDEIQLWHILNRVLEVMLDFRERLERIERCACKKRVVGYRIRQVGGDMQPISGAGSFYPKPEAVKQPEPSPAEAQFKESDKLSETQTAVIGVVAGATGTFVADAIDQNGNVITDPAILSGLTIVWSSSDTTDEPVVSSGTAGDLGASITVPATAPANTTGATLSVVDQNGIGGSVAVPVLPATTPPPPVTVAGYVIRQTA